MQETTEHAHNRSERRCGSVVPAPANAPDFPGLTAFGRIEPERRTAAGKLTQSTHSVVMSRRLPAWRMMSVTRRRYRDRNVIERAFAHIKDWRRVATRYDKLARNFKATVTLAAILVF